MYKKIIAIFLIIVMTFSLISCSSKSSDSNKSNTKVVNVTDDSDRLDIVTTNQFIYYMVKDIVKNNHNVSYIFADEDSLWNYEFNDSDIKKIKPCDIFIYTGADFEPWISKYINAMNKNKTSLVNMSRGINLLQHDDFVKYKDSRIKDNPYYWMDVDNYLIALSNITSSIQEKDPKNREYYSSNYDDYKKSLSKYEDKLKSLSDKLNDYTFIVDGDKYDYLIKYLKLKSIKYTLLDNDDKKLKNEQKIKEAKNPVLLYDNDILLTYHNDIIKNYNIKTIQFTSYISGQPYQSILDYDIKKLESIYTDTDKSN